MSGELTLTQFRYTVTNNRDFVIGDPTDATGLTLGKYLVFQTNTTSGYSANPYIAAVPDPSNPIPNSFKVVISNDGSTLSNFAYQDKPNIFTAVNSFNSTTTFNNTVTFSSGVSIIGTPTFNQGMIITGSTAGYTSHPGYSCYIDGNCVITGILEVGSISSTVINYNVSSSSIVAVNNGVGGTLSSAQANGGPGIIVWQGGDFSVSAGGPKLASLQMTNTTNVIDTLTFTPYNNGSSVFNGPIKFVSDITKAYTVNTVGLTAARTYSWPDANGTIVLTSTLPAASTITLTGSITGSGTTSIATSLTPSQSAAITWSGAQTISNATTASSTSSGAVVVTGGVGIGNNLYVGGTGHITGTLAVTGAITGSSTITGTQIISTITTGTAPLTVVSTTPVANLTAQYCQIPYVTSVSSVGPYYLSFVSGGNAYTSLNTSTYFSVNPSNGLMSVANITASGTGSSLAGVSFGNASSQGSISYVSTTGLMLRAKTGSVNDFTIETASGGSAAYIPTGSSDVYINNNLHVGGSIIGTVGGTAKAHASLFRSSSISLTSPITPTAFGFGSAANGNLHITPTSSGTIMIIVNTTAANQFAGTSFINIIYGTGTAPNNGANAGLETSVISPYASCIFQAGGEYLPFGVSAITVSGLTLSTSYWFDLTAYSSTVGNIGLYSTSITLIEI